MSEPRIARIASPKISIDNVSLSAGQISTLRMALGCLKLDLHQAAAQRKFGSHHVAQHLRHLEELQSLIGEGGEG
jgi:hypothetical protein